MLADLDSLPTNFLCAVGDAAANQLAAYILVRNSACKYASDSRAGQIFSTDRKFDEFAAQLVRNKDVPISLSGQERLTLFLPVGQIALLVAFMFCPKASARVDKVLIARIKELTFISPDGTSLLINGLNEVEKELSAVIDSRSRADNWHEVGEALINGMNGADHITFVDQSGFGAAPKGINRGSRNWSEFTSAWDAHYVQCAEGGAPPLDDQDISDIIHHLGRFQQAVEEKARRRAPTSAPTRLASLHQPTTTHPGLHPSARAYVPPPHDHADEAPTMALAATQAQRGPRQRCWNLNCKASVQPAWNTCLACSTGRPGAWECKECSMDNKPDAKTCFTKGCTGVANSGLPLSARTAALADALGRAKAAWTSCGRKKGGGRALPPTTQ
jgi:hypothetical protein